MLSSIHDLHKGLAVLYTYLFIMILHIYSLIIQLYHMYKHYYIPQYILFPLFQSYTC